MANIVRHVGKLKNTGVKCVVVFRKIEGRTEENIPEDREHAIIVETDTLSDMYQDNLRKVVESPEAQQTHDLYTVLNRRTFSDGGNMLTTLHNKGLLRKVPTDLVVLHPLPNQLLMLREANNAIDGVDVYNPLPKSVTETPVQTETEQKTSVAHGLLAQAALLEEDARKKREEAYALDPSLKPTVGRVELSQEEKQRRKAESNAKRRKKKAELQ